MPGAQARFQINPFNYLVKSIMILMDNYPVTFIFFKFNCKCIPLGPEIFAVLGETSLKFRVGFPVSSNVPDGVFQTIDRHILGLFCVFF